MCGTTDISAFILKMIECARVEGVYQLTAAKRGQVTAHEFELRPV